MPLTEAEIFEGMGLEPPATDGAGQDVPPAEGDGQGAGQEGDGQIQDNGATQTDMSDLDTQEPGGDQPPAANPAPAQPPAAPAQVPAADQTPAQTPTQPSAGTQPQAPAGMSSLDQPAPPEVRGKTDPYTGQVIQTLAQYQAYQRAYQADVADLERKRMLDQLKGAGVDAKVLENMIKDAVAKDPTVLAARELSEAVRAQAEEAQTKEALDWFEQQIKEINAMDPGVNVQDLYDLQQRDPGAFARMMGAVSGGMSLVEAYRGIHHDRLAQSRSSAAQQKARNQAAGKAHMAPVGSGKGGAGEEVSVPEAVMRQYRALNPGMTEAEIRKEYARYLKDSGGAAG